MLKKLLSSGHILDNWPVIIRVITGIIIAEHGIGVFNQGHMDGNVAWLTDIHLPVPVFMAYLGKSTELLGGIMLIAGLFTRVAAMALIINMAVITFLMGQGKIFSEDQLPFLLLLLFAGYIFYGAGKWSVDYLLFDRKKNKP